MRSRTKLSPGKQLRQENTKWIDRRVLTRLLVFLMSLEPHFQNEKQTLAYSSPVPASQLKEKMLKHHPTKVRTSKFPLSYQSLVTNLLFVACQKTSLPPSFKKYMVVFCDLYIWAAKITQGASLIGEMRRKQLSWETFGDFKTIWCFFRKVPKLHRYNTYKS